MYVRGDEVSYATGSPIRQGRGLDGPERTSAHALRLARGRGVRAHAHAAVGVLARGAAHAGDGQAHHDARAVGGVARRP
ncbi:hypothetical protein JYU34_009528 [Plutella xylostella]|uniref:Uncharacterized protein n=1 Tax=Plutella xylostella TaxID=51655 RepID=A0ABQ7QJQ6_PLUXY|nr:hypothetical protein JYU34_009528 [Plutella xylostella]